MRFVDNKKHIEQHQIKYQYGLKNTVHRSGSVLLILINLSAAIITSVVYQTVFRITGEKHYLQQLVTAKLLATSRLSMCGVSLKSAIPNWTMPTLNALYSWSAPLGNKPPEEDTDRQTGQLSDRQEDRKIRSETAELYQYNIYYITQIITEDYTKISLRGRKSKCFLVVFF